MVEMLWRAVRDHYRRDMRTASSSFSRFRDAPPTVFKAEGGEYYRLVLELAATTRIVAGGNLDATDALRVWARRLELVELEMRRQLGEDVVDKARSLVSRDVRAPRSSVRPTSD